MTRMKIGRWFTLFTAMLALCLLALPARVVADDDDPPARAARLSYSSGAVSFEPAGTDDWVDAVVNRPMTTGDKLWADQDGRAEVRIDSYALRLGAQTGFSFLNLDDNIVQVRLTEGSLNVKVRRLDDNQTLEIDTPNLAFNVLRPGSYRIDVNENGDTTVVTVREGQGEVTGGGSAYPLRSGDSATFSGIDQLNVDVEGYGDDDDFDRWTQDRDRRWDRSNSSRYVSDDVVGYEDLDDNGSWRQVPDYGTVWFPQTTVVGWAPYRYGHWVWVSPWGWTWVDDAPWGFAPFHYGRWVVVGGAWCWVPSPPRPAVVTVAYVRPVYAPALVAFVGGAGFGVGVGSGVAWFPLGPRDVYTPSYHVSERYVQRVNVSNTVIVNRTQVTNVYNTVYVNKTVNVTNITYQNQRANNAVTATSQASFTSAQPVGRNMVRVDSRAVASAPVAAMTPAVAPQQRSFTGAGNAARVRPPANLVTRNVVAKTAPPPAPVPVAQQMQAVQANGGRPPAVSQIRPVQGSPAARANVKVAAPAKEAALPPRGQGVSNRPGQPNRANQPAAQSQQNNNRPANINQPNQPAAVQPNANRPANENTANPNRPNANQPVNPNANNPNQDNRNQDNRDRVNPNQPAAAQPNPPASNPNRPNPNRPGNAPSNTNQPNTDRPTDNRQPPPAVRQNADPQLQQRQQQQADQLRQQQQQQHERAEQQQAQQQQKLEQQKADDQKRQAVQRQQQQQNQDLERKHQQQQQQLDQKQQKEVQKQQPKDQQKDKDNKDKDKKDRPPSR